MGLVEDQASVEGLGVAARRALQCAVVGEEEVVVEKTEVRRRAEEAWCDSRVEAVGEAEGEGGDKQRTAAHATIWSMRRFFCLFSAISDWYVQNITPSSTSGGSSPYGICRARSGEGRGGVSTAAAQAWRARARERERERVQGSALRARVQSGAPCGAGTA